MNNNQGKYVCSDEESEEMHMNVCSVTKDKVKEDLQGMSWVEADDLIMHLVEDPRDQLLSKAWKNATFL